MKNIHSICKKVYKITDEEFEEAFKESYRQVQYSHPLKGGTALKVNVAGNHNLTVLLKLKELREVIRNGEQ